MNNFKKLFKNINNFANIIKITKNKNVKIRKN